MSDFSSRKRLLNTLSLEEVDRTPIFPYGIDPYNKEIWMNEKPSYQPLINLVRERCDVMHGHKGGLGIELPLFLSATKEVNCETRKYFNNDVVTIENLIRTSEGLLNSIARKRKGFPLCKVKGYLETDDDLKTFLSIPYEPFEPDLACFFQADEKLADKVAISLDCPEPIGNVAPLFIWEKFVKKVYTEKETVLQLLEIMFERSYDYMKYLFSRGVKGIFWLVGPEYVAPPLFSPRIFEEMAVDYAARLVTLIHRHGSLAVIHCHGRIRKILDLLKSTGTDGLHPVEPPPLGDTPLKEAKRRIGDQVCIVGNVDIGDILLCSRQEIRQKVTKTIIDGSPTGLILSTSASPHWAILPEKTYYNYVEFVETGEKIGKQRIQVQS